MGTRDLGTWLAASVAAALLLALLTGVGTASAGMQVSLVPSIHIGWKADKTTGANSCTVASRDECQSSTPTGSAGGFNYPDSVAADPRTGDIYVTEITSDRVQELTAAGTFVSMFGWDVNKTDAGRATATQAERNVCTAASHDVCQGGLAGARAGQLDSPESVAVDRVTGDIYVLQLNTDDFRVDKFTRDSKFVWRAGKGVNRTTGANLCTAREIERAAARCGAGARSADGSTERGAFKFATQPGNLLAVGGPEHLLYVGDEHRVQVFGTDGSWKREMLLASLSAEQQSSVVALALAASGELYVVYRVGKVETYLPSERANIIHKLNPGGEQVAEYHVGARSPGALDSIGGMALNGSNQLAVIGVEGGTEVSGRFGSLVSAATGALLAEFKPPIDNDGIAFDGYGDLYVATAVDQEVAVYEPVAATGTLAAPVPCEAFGTGSQAPFDCLSR